MLRGISKLGFLSWIQVYSMFSREIEHPFFINKYLLYLFHRILNFKVIYLVLFLFIVGFIQHYRRRSKCWPYLQLTQKSLRNIWIITWRIQFTFESIQKTSHWLVRVLSNCISRLYFLSLLWKVSSRLPWNRTGKSFYHIKFRHSFPTKFSP